MADAQQTRRSPKWLVDGLVAYGYRLPDHPGKWRVHDKLIRLLKPALPPGRLVTRHGLVWRLTIDDHPQSLVYWHGVRDRWEIEQLAVRLPADAVFIEAGANFGYHSATLLRRLGRRSRAIVFEPHPDNHQRLLDTIRLNGLGDQIECHATALSDTPGSALMAIQPGNTGHAHVTDDSGGATVSVTTLDDHVQQHPLDRLDALLLDVEGLEDKALRGAAKTIARFRPIILVEMFPVVLEKQGSSAAAVAALLEQYGYKLYTAQKHQLRPVEGLPVGDVRIYALCFHKDRLHKDRAPPIA